MSSRVTVIDYGIGNILSVMRALEAIGATAVLSDDAHQIQSADRLLLPGVGAFADGMTELRRRNLVEAIQAFVARGRPFLGICLGMQLLFETSEEFGEHQGLGLLKGRVQAIPAYGANGQRHKIPHIGWNALVLPANRDNWAGSILSETPVGTAVYFVHSFAVVPSDSSDRLADCDYNGLRLCAAISRANIYGCQFHPEKSGERGLNILRRFILS